MALKIMLNKFLKNTDKTVSVYAFDTPVGTICGAADDDFLYIVIFEDSKNFQKSFQTLSERLSCGYIENKNKLLLQLEIELSDYFVGERKSFEVPIKTFGSDFQEAVWLKLRDLPYASTQTYGELAKALGRSTSHARAIGSACGANTHVIVTPCHRIICTGSGGGYTSGVDRKEWLIEHEKKNAKN